LEEDVFGNQIFHEAGLKTFC